MPEAVTDILIVGGGIVGLATAHALAGRFPHQTITVCEKERAVGLHQSSRNSGVIHSGIYYRPGSSKARFCTEGAALLRAFCHARGIRVVECGKVIVAASDEEVARLDELLARGRANRVPGLERIGPERLQEIEPHALGRAAIYSPHTAIVDFGEVCRAMSAQVQQHGVQVWVGARVAGVTAASGELVVHTDAQTLRTRYLINCAGLYADQIARRCGAVVDVRIVPFRGEYYLVKPERRHLVRGLIYPVPDPGFPFLGVHFTTTVHGEVEAGPNAVLAFAREGYTLGRVSLSDVGETLAYRGFWAMARRYWRAGVAELWRSLSVRAFARSLQRLVPEVRVEDLVRGGAGVRAQAVARDGLLVDDFRIVRSARAIHVLNAPSPGATASLAIGAHITALAAEAFGLA